MEKLRGFERKYLRGLAHGLKPVVQVGREGVTPSLIGAAELALADHELIKVKFSGHKEERRELSLEIAARTGSERVGLLGHTAVYYRPPADAGKRKIILPPPRGKATG